MHNKILFLTLRVFSATGGIEKVCRIAGKAMYEMTLQLPVSVQIFSMHDDNIDVEDNKYFPSELFRGFRSSKIKFVKASVEAGLKSDIIIISHVNLVLIGWLIKKIAPAKRIILFAHGIEVWEKLSKRKQMMLPGCDEIFSVSEFTRQKLHDLHGFPLEKCRVFNNCLDPFLPLPSEVKSERLLGKYGFNINDTILFGLTRISSKERYKGYDKVMEAIKNIKVNYPRIRYFLAGKYNQKEKKYLDDMKEKMDLDENIIMPGFVADKDLGDHFGIADIYIMPSIKEGFGIVFIEAMYYGVPVIAGNLDGSVDALSNGELGLLINPVDVKEIQCAIEKIIANKKMYIPNRELLLKKFSYTAYKNNLKMLLYGPDSYAGCN